MPSYWTQTRVLQTVKWSPSHTGELATRTCNSWQVGSTKFVVCRKKLNNIFHSWHINSVSNVLVIWFICHEWQRFPAHWEFNFRHTTFNVDAASSPACSRLNVFKLSIITPVCLKENIQCQELVNRMNILLDFSFKKGKGVRLESNSCSGLTKHVTKFCARDHP